MQQAELLSSLALKVNTENTDQSLENAWKVRNNFAFALISSHPMFFSRTGPLSWIGPILKYIWFAYVGFT